MRPVPGGATVNDEATLSERVDQSPLARYRDHLARDELAFQVAADGTPVFFPRVLAPGTGEADLAWRTSAGLGTVYATTTVYARGEPPYNVALIDMDEGFRLMGQLADEAAIGDPVMARIVTGGIGEPLVMFSRAVSREA